MSDASRYPFDYEQLHKGDVIDSHTIERVTGVSRESGDAFRFAMMGLAAEIERGMEQAHAEEVTVVSRGQTLVILTDREAIPYNDDTGKKALRKYGKAFRRMGGINRDNLTDDERRDHADRMTVMASVFAAIGEGRRRGYAKLAAHKRNVPGLPATTEATA